MVLVIRADESVVVILEGLQQHNTGSVLVAKERDGVIHPLLQIAEAYDVAKGLDAVQNTVGPAEGLDQTVHLQILVHPQRIERGGVKAGEEHIDHDQEVQFLVLHAEGNVLVIVLELVPVRRIVGMEHPVIIPDAGVQEITGGLIQCGGILGVFLVQNTVRVRLVRPIAVDGRNPQILCGISGHLLLEFLIIQLCHLDGGHTEDAVEAADPLLLLDLLHGAAGGRGHIGDIDQGIEEIRLVPAIGLLIKVVEDILRDQLDPLRRHEGLLSVDIPYVLVINVRVGVHRFDVIHAERQDVFVIDSVHDGIGMELIAKGLLRCEELRIPHGAGVRRENRRPGKAKEMIPLEALDDRCVHIAELAAVAFVKNDDHVLLINLVDGILFDEGSQLLDRGYDDPAFVLFQLLFQNGSGRVAVGRAFLKAVVFLHGLVVQILPVYHKEHLVDLGHRRRQPRCFEGGQRLAGAGRMPDIAAARHAAVFFVVRSDHDAVQDTFRCRDLVGAHHKKHLLRGEDAVPGQNVQNGMAGKEGPREVDQIGDHDVVAVRPIGRELEAVRGLFLLPAAGLVVLDGVEAGAVGIVLRVRTVADDEDLHILKQAAAGPKGIALVAVDLIEGLADGDAPALQFDMDKGQTVYQHRHVITVIMPGALILADGILIDDLKEVVMYVLLVDQQDILAAAVVPFQNLDKILLDLPGLLHDMLVGIGDALCQKTGPLGIGEGIAVQPFELRPQIGEQLRLRVDRQVFIALHREHTNEFPFQLRFALIAVGTGLYGLILCDHGVFSCLRDNVEIWHTHSPLATLCVFFRSSKRSGLTKLQKQQSCKSEAVFRFAVL